MGRTADASRVAFWRELIERRRRSSLSVAQVCEQASVSTASFYLWQRKLRDGTHLAGRTALRNAQPARRTAPRLVPVHIVADALAHRDAASMLEVELPREIRLRIPAGCDAATLQVVLSLLLKEVGAEASSC